MRLAWVTTKPPWPPLDGGRLVAARTVEALVQAGHVVEVFAPDLGTPARADAPALGWTCALRLVHAAPRPLWRAALRAMLTRQAVTIVRHSVPPVGCMLALRMFTGARFDAVVAEQVQALAQCGPAFLDNVPVVLRAQNVESALWAAEGMAPPLLRGLARREAARLAAYEGDAVRRVALTLALTPEDAGHLRRLAGASVASVVPVAAPFPADLPPADVALPGAPAVVLFGSTGWRPNASGATWFIDRVWPPVRAALPAARLHVFGALARRAAARDALVAHPAPADSRTAFAPGSILVVPLHVASGVRVRILEAWARGVPVVATPQAAAGLGAEDGRELLLARDAAEFAGALARLASQAGLPEALTRAGRARLRAVHDPETIAARIEELLSALKPIRSTAMDISNDDA